MKLSAGTQPPFHPASLAWEHKAACTSFIDVADETLSEMKTLISLMLENFWQGKYWRVRRELETDWLVMHVSVCSRSLPSTSPQVILKRLLLEAITIDVGMQSCH